MHVVVGSWEVSRARLAAPFFLPLGSSALERTDTGALVSEDVEGVVVHQFIFHLGDGTGRWGKWLLAAERTTPLMPLNHKFTVYLPLAPLP